MLTEFYRNCWNNFVWVVDSFSSDTLKVFWSSLVWGRSHEAWGSRTPLSRLFFDLGMIHVLVLSGSQVLSFYRVQQFFVGVFLRVFGLSRRSFWAKAGLFCCWIFLFLYVAATGAQAPLVRAFIVLAASEAKIFGRGLRRIASCFLLHVVLFPDHVGGLSFVLSWCAFLILILLKEWGVPRLLGLTLMCVLTQILVVFLKGASGIGGLSWKGIVSNLIFVPLFEAVIFPMGSFLALFAVGASFGVNLGGTEGVMRRIFDCGTFLHGILAQVFLGALKGIRYI